MRLRLAPRVLREAELRRGEILAFAAVDTRPVAFTILRRVGVVACLLLRGLEEPREEEDFIE